VRGDPINGFIPTHLYVCPKPGLEFQRHMSWSFLMFYELRGDVKKDNYSYIHSLLIHFVKFKRAFRPYMKRKIKQLWIIIPPISTNE
jgi:hypothetical protein